MFFRIGHWVGVPLRDPIPLVLVIDDIVEDDMVIFKTPAVPDSFALVVLPMSTTSQTKCLLILPSPLFRSDATPE